MVQYFFDPKKSLFPIRLNYVIGFFFISVINKIYLLTENISFLYFNRFFNWIIIVNKLINFWVYEILVFYSIHAIFINKIDSHRWVFKKIKAKLIFLSHITLIRKILLILIFIFFMYLQNVYYQISS